MKKFILLGKKITLLAYTSLLPIFCYGNINLRLHEKPKNISVYKWCKKQAKNLVKAKKNKLLQMLHVDNKEWQEIQGTFVLQTKAKRIKQFIPDYIKTCVHNILSNPDVIRKFNIIKVIDTNKEIIALTSSGKNLHFIATNSEMMGTSGQTIFINPTKMRKFTSSDKEIEAGLGHELGHLLREHQLEDICLTKIWKKKILLEETPSQEQLTQAFLEFRRAYETEADITGIFNDRNLAQAGHAFFWNLAKIQPSAQKKNHPSDQKRANYLKIIQQHMAMELQRRPGDKKINSIITPKQHKAIPITMHNHRKNVIPNMAKILKPNHQLISPVLQKRKQDTLRQKMQQIAFAAAKKRMAKQLQKPPRKTTNNPKKIPASQKKVSNQVKQKKKAQPQKIFAPIIKPKINTQQKKVPTSTYIKKAYSSSYIFSMLTNWIYFKKLLSLSIIIGLSAISYNLL